jgi:hypothetical protein
VFEVEIAAYRFEIIDGVTTFYVVEHRVTSSRQLMGEPVIVDLHRRPTPTGLDAGTPWWTLEMLHRRTATVLDSAGGLSSSGSRGRRIGLILALQHRTTAEDDARQSQPSWQARRHVPR